MNCVAVVESAPVFSRPLSNLRVNEGQQAKLECHVTGSPCPQLNWFVDGAELSSSAEFTIRREGALCWLVINEVLAEDEGQYTVTASNLHGTTSTAAYLTVISKSTIYISVCVYIYSFSLCIYLLHFHISCLTDAIIHLFVVIDTLYCFWLMMIMMVIIIIIIMIQRYNSFLGHFVLTKMRTSSHRGYCCF